MNLKSTKARPPAYYEREIARYDEKLKRALNPTQRAYAFGMKRAAMAALEKSREGFVADPADPNVVNLEKDEYEAIDQ